MNNRYIIIILLLVGSLVPAAVQAQGPAIVTQELCWAVDANTDSSIVAYYLFSSREDEPLVVNYLDSRGNTVAVPGDAELTIGKCCCETAGGNTMRADNVHISEMCWFDGLAYTSINRVILATSVSTDPLIITYRDADGNTVDVQDGDSIFYGYCDCCTGNPN